MRALFLFTLMFLMSLSCKNTTNDSQLGTDSDNWRERNKIVAVTSYNSTNYFIYKGQPMGFQYELLQDLANDLGVKLEVIVTNNIDEAFDKLLSGEADIIASNLTITKQRRKQVNFTTPLGKTRQVLVQRKPKKWRQLSAQQINNALKREALDLAGEKVYVQKRSAYVNRLRNISDEIGDTLFISEVDFEVEELIKQVTEGKIGFTVCDENVAEANKSIYPELDFETPLSFSQYYAWAMRKGSQELLVEINGWLEEFTESKKYARIHSKYFNNKYLASKRKSDFFIVEDGRISVFDDQIKKYSEQIGWDWRLLASLIYQESRFKPHVTSFAGAYGLMQLMPRTAERFGVDSTSTPEEHIIAGVRYLKWLDKRFTNIIMDDNERIKFILAGYNAGYGHVLDAMKLAEKFGKDPTKWNDNVDFFVLNKSNPKYFKDPAVVYGYCRGDEAYNYVYEILERYSHYRNIVMN